MPTKCNLAFVPGKLLQCYCYTLRGQRGRYIPNLCKDKIYIMPTFISDTNSTLTASLPAVTDGRLETSEELSISDALRGKEPIPVEVAVVAQGD